MCLRIPTYEMQKTPPSEVIRTHLTAVRNQPATSTCDAVVRRALAGAGFAVNAVVGVGETGGAALTLLTATVVEKCLGVDCSDAKKGTKEFMLQSSTGVALSVVSFFENFSSGKMSE